MMRSIFGENLFDDFFGNDLDLFPALPGSKALYGKHAKNLMKTDVRETENSYELDIDLPGFKKDEEMCIRDRPAPVRQNFGMTACAGRSSRRGAPRTALPLLSAIFSPRNGPYCATTPERPAPRSSICKRGIPSGSWAWAASSVSFRCV